jgi:hypothetical protein
LGGSLDAAELLANAKTRWASTRSVKKGLAAQGWRSCLPLLRTVQLAPLLARVSTDDQFKSGIDIFIAGLQAQQPTPQHST